MAAIDVVNRVLREFKRYTGDGLANEPVGAPLPVGDPASGVWNPRKSDLREALLAPIGEAEQSASEAGTQASHAEEWAQSPDPISVAAGGDGVNDKSSKTWAGESAASAGSAALSSAAAGAASGRLDVAAFAELATKFVYSSPGPGQEQVAAGDVILWREKGFAYQVLASGAADAHLDYTGEGGVKLYLLPLAGWYHLDGLGAAGDASSSDIAAWNASTDDGPIIQKFLDLCGSTKVPGWIGAKQYRTNQGLVINYDGTVIEGHGSDYCGLMYGGDVFVDVVKTVDATVRKDIRLENFAIRGGFYQLGKARYSFYAEMFNIGCSLRGMLFREGLGNFKIEQGYYATVGEIRCEAVVPNQTINGCDNVQWNEVNGTDSAPVYLGVMNGCTVGKLTIRNVAGEARSNAPVPVSQAVWLSGDAAIVTSLTIEGLGTPIGEYTPSLNRAVKFAATGSINTRMSIRPYFEAVNTHINIFDADRHSGVRVDDMEIYHVESNAIVTVNGIADISFENYLGYRVKVQRLSAVSGSLATYPSVHWGRGVLCGGERVSDGGSGNVYDTAGTAWPLGINNGTAGITSQTPTALYRKQFPRVLFGLAVTSGSDSNGAYVQIAGGTFVNEGGVGRNVCWRDNTGTELALTRLRPDEASKFYRVWVGEAGQLFLTKHDTDPTSTPEGDWLAQFQTDGSNAITGLAANPRLSYDGVYERGNICIVYHAGWPTNGYWRAGSEVFRTDAGAGGYPRSRRITSGTATDQWRNYAVLGA